MSSEYKRQIVIKLLSLSDWMISELDSTSANYWNKHMHFVNQRVDAISVRLKKSKTIKKNFPIRGELWIDPWLYRQHNFSNLLDSDPFVPKNLRRRISSFYGTRVVDMSLIYTSVMTKFFTEQWPIDNEKSADKKANCWVQLNDAYYQEGWGWENTHKKIIQFRYDIEQYLTRLK